MKELKLMFYILSYNICLTIGIIFLIRNFLDLNYNIMFNCFGASSFISLWYLIISEKIFIKKS